MTSPDPEIRQTPRTTSRRNDILIYSLCIWLMLSGFDIYEGSPIQLALAFCALKTLGALIGYLAFEWASKTHIGYGFLFINAGIISPKRPPQPNLSFRQQLEYNLVTAVLMILMSVFVSVIFHLRSASAESITRRLGPNRTKKPSENPFAKP